MRLIVFPGGEQSPSEQAWLAELDAALYGQAEGPAAESWRELRANVRALAPAPSEELMARLERMRSLEPRLKRKRQIGSRLKRKRSLARRSERRRSREWRRPQLAGAAALLAALVVAALVVASGQLGRSAAPRAVPSPRVASPRVASAPARSAPSGESQAAPLKAAATQAAGGSGAGSSLGAPVQSSPAQAPGRVQQLAASVSLSATSASVQAVSDGVAQLAVREEGYVQSSHVQVQQQGSSEATLTLRLPSARLGAALEAISRLAQVSAESQSLQDITNSYDAARRRLADATAERRALLRALAKATTEGQIDSLRERLAQARAAIVRAQSALNAVSQRASTAEVEVTVLGDGQAHAEGLTLDRGLHDAGRVLTVAAVVALIAAAVLVPLALLLGALLLAVKISRRYSRERTLR
jgi:hypothetical protein